MPWMEFKEERDRIYLNEWVHEEQRLVRNEEHVKIVKYWFEDAKKQSYPKIMSFNQAEEQGIVNQRKPYKDEWMSNLQSYGKAWLDRGHLPTPASPDWANDKDWLSPRTINPETALYEEERRKEYLKKKNITHQTWNEWMANPEDNMYFHANKIQWLVNIIKTEGLYSTPQAVYMNTHWFPHPGSFRVHAIEYADCNEDFVVWDYTGKLKGTEIRWEDYWDLYKHHLNRQLFCVNFGGHMEMHVGEERDDLYNVIVGSDFAFRGQKPILQGTCDDSLKDLFTHGTYEGHGVGIVGHFSEDDLPHILDFHPTKQYFEKENFTLYNNYHK